jgi:hypothetical protein
MKNIAKTCLFIVAVMLLTVTKINAQVSVGVGISATFGPPPLPVYVQPPCPVEGYLWEPGYWAWDPDDGDYYWVPGVWVAPPTVGFLWTPSYWGFSDGVSRRLLGAGSWILRRNKLWLWLLRHRLCRRSMAGRPFHLQYCRCAR